MFTPRQTKIDVTRYHQMIDAGIFRPGERIELIEGEMLDMAPIGSRHSAAVMALTDLLYDTLDRALTMISVQNSLVLGDISEPQPDVLVLRSRADRYRDAVPRASDVLLLIEVSDTTLHYDRTRKIPLYARFGITESWIVNLVEGQLEVFREPRPQGYAVQTVLDRQTAATPAALPGVALAWGPLLG